MSTPSKPPTAAAPTPAPAKERLETDPNFYLRRHLRFGWWCLLFFLTLGLALETLHGLKVGWYLNVSNQTRRLVWTLGHAHGTLLALLNIAFGVSVPLLTAWEPRSRAVASAFLIAAAVLLPGGFLLGGLFIYAGDPGLGILLVPLGAVLLFVAVLLTAYGTKSLEARAGHTEVSKRR